MQFLQAEELTKLEALTGNELAQRWRGMEKRLSMQNVVTIANTGLVNAGKSSLFNALLDSYETERFPVGAVRTTKFGKRESLAEGIDILDTPGIDATDGDDEEAFSALMESDLIVAVHNIKIGMLNRGEYDWLQRLASRMTREEVERKIIFACTWIDERERQEDYRSAVEETKRQAFEALGSDQVPFWEVSAKRYLLARQKGKEKMLDASKVPEFKAYLLRRAAEARASADDRRQSELTALCRDTREQLGAKRQAAQKTVEQKERAARQRYQPAFDTWKMVLGNFVSSRDKVKEKVKTLADENDSYSDMQAFRSRLNSL